MKEREREPRNKAAGLILDFISRQKITNTHTLAAMSTSVIVTDSSTQKLWMFDFPTARRLMGYFHSLKVKSTFVNLPSDNIGPLRG